MIDKEVIKKLPDDKIAENLKILNDELKRRQRLGIPSEVIADLRSELYKLYTVCGDFFESIQMEVTNKINVMVSLELNSTTMTTKLVGDSSYSEVHQGTTVAIDEALRSEYPKLWAKKAKIDAKIEKYKEKVAKVAVKYKVEEAKVWALLR